MRYSKFRTLFIVFFWCFCVPLSAQVSEYAMRNETVSSNRKEQIRGEVYAKMDMLHRDSQFFYTYRSVGDLLSEHSQFVVNTLNPLAQSYQSRGFGASDFAYTLDGISLNTNLMRSNLWLQMFQPAQFSKVEILYGNQSVLYGRNAAAGIIGLYQPTFEYSEMYKAKFSGSMSYQSARNGYYPQLSLHLSNRKWSSNTYFSALFQGDYRVGNLQNSNLNNYGTEPYVLSIPNGMDEKAQNPNPNQIQNSNFNQYFLSEQFHFKQDEESEWRFGFYSQFGVQYRATEYDGFNGSEQPLFATAWHKNTPNILATMQYETRQERTIFSKCTTSVSFQRAESVDAMRQWGSMFQKQNDQSVSKMTVQIDAHKNLNARWVFFYGLDFSGELNSKNSESQTITPLQIVGKASFFNYQNAETFLGNGYFKTEYRMSDNVSYHLGVRAGFQENAQEMLYNNLFNINEIPERLRGNLAVNLTWTRHSCENSNYSFSLLYQNRNPLLSDMMPPSYWRTFVPNFDLKNETLYGAELNIYKKINDKIEFQFSPYLYLQNHSFSMQNGYNGADSIVLDEHYALATATNLPFSYAFGASLNVKCHISKYLMAYSTLDFTEKRAWETGQYLLNHSPFYGKIGVQFKQNHWFANLWGEWNTNAPARYISALPNENERFGAYQTSGAYFGYSGYFVANVQVLYRTQYGNLGLKCYNLWDQNYRNYGSYLSGTGRNVVLSAAFRLGGR